MFPRKDDALHGHSPGAVPELLRDPSIHLFRAEDRVFDEMLDRWGAQMLARGLQVDTIKPRLRLLRRFQSHVGTYPWSWAPADLEDYLAERRASAKPISLTTLRSEGNAIAMFCSFLTNPIYEWERFCAEVFDDVPSQICFEWNMPRHKVDDAVPTGRRAFTRAELSLLFEDIDDEVDTARSVGSRRWRTLLRDSVAFKVCYAYGLRRREVAMLETSDFSPNPHVSEYGPYGAVLVRWAKGVAASGPRRRTVLTVPRFEWVVDVLERWMSPAGRSIFATSDRSPALWPSERGRLGVGSLGDAFTAARERAQLPEELGLHCLRHSYVTHLIEAGYDPAFVQVQVGHSAASTTGLYTSVSADFKQKSIQKMIAKRIKEEDPMTET